MLRDKAQTEKMNPETQASLQACGTFCTLNYVVQRIKYIFATLTMVSRIWPEEFEPEEPEIELSRSRRKR
jgi:hypothetical protein